MAIVLSEYQTFWPLKPSCWQIFSKLSLFCIPRQDRVSHTVNSREWGSFPTDVQCSTCAHCKLCAKWTIFAQLNRREKRNIADFANTILLPSVILHVVNHSFVSLSPRLTSSEFLAASNFVQVLKKKFSSLT